MSHDIAEPRSKNEWIVAWRTFALRPQARLAPRPHVQPTRTQSFPDETSASQFAALLRARSSAGTVITIRERSVS